MTRHFCLCLSLKTGAIIMSFLNLLEGSVEIVVSLIELSSDMESKEALHRLGEHADALDAVCNVTHFCNGTAIRNTGQSRHLGMEGTITMFSVCLIVGLLSLFNGVLLLIGLMQAKEKYVLWYVLLGSVVVLIVTIFSGIYMFEHGAILLLFVLSLFMCYGQLAMYHFYEELAEYNTVKSGVIEISYNGDARSYANSVVPTDDKVDSTAL
ncbi:hypothetical protein Zmor_009482 [Zophobas morio]|uniref:Uncharacterized protein n=2 Tax=Zophobas morio TaxID=2755281 RepID=A0AA38MI22_9CUCU|nr:hypothetical protein Zmor_009482 [Zophobas morio]